ncbi:MAG TPA: hypothetical protein VK646_00860 [Actinomycetota bacterium]|nr:hypothetical protein [Actinomycetota bacterium]
MQKRIRIEKPKAPRERWWLEVLPLDPRDPDVVRAKALLDGGASPTARRRA